MSYYIPLPICVYVCAARVVIFTDRVAHTLEHNPRQVGAPSPVKMGGNHNLIWQLALRKKKKRASLFYAQQTGSPVKLARPRQLGLNYIAGLLRDGSYRNKPLQQLFLVVAADV